jgi:two-component system, chemotaxis family, response regulator Rcp1
MSRVSSHVPAILVVEDDPADLRLTMEMLEDAGFEHQLLIARDGAEALAMLHKLRSSVLRPLPDLVLLDLQLPGMGGLELLRAMKRDPDLRRIPVIVLSISDDAGEIRKVYDLHGNAFLTKPAEWRDFATLGRHLRDFWFQVAALPPTDR